MAYYARNFSTEASNVLPSGKAASALAVGDLVYLTSSGTWALAASAALGETSRTDALGIMVQNALIYETVSPVRRAVINGWSSLTIGVKYYLSTTGTTGNTVTATEPTTTIREVVGFASSATDISFDVGGVGADLDVGGDMCVDTLVVGGTALTAATHNINSTSTSASTDGALTVEPNLFTATMTGAAGVGRSIRATLNVTNVALGGWSNAIKGLIDFKTSGSVAGLGSAICGEMVMPGSTMPGLGTYGVLELELVCPASWAGSNPVSFIYCEVSGATKTNFDAYGYLFTIAGVTSGAASVWYDHDGTSGGDTIGEWIRVKTPSGARYIGLCDAVH